MKKLKLKRLSEVGNVLTSNELKRIYGGTTGSSEGSKECHCEWNDEKNKCEPNKSCPSGVECWHTMQGDHHICTTKFPYK